jgi:hypothetical protein
VKVCFNTGVLAFPLGYMTSAHPIAQCRAQTSGQVSCGWLPTDRLKDNDAVVAITTAPLISSFKRNAVIANRPAQVDTELQRNVSTGSRYHISVLVQIGHQNTVRVDGYFGAASTEARAAFLHMLHTASYYG